ncbi:hypothetical protein ASPZODRAFT_148441 [Penicilliopsis zonata CBS 506.65]|uniref:RING-type domain-containing protein n=1 Tax=Penicilliopsis zonata CBS 506.65 TaxID=1073090 RepID=A0A1L9SV30_9EURO|nr:hypothetical protein ASPZODRAFT_148441 [Penicilliopsis zonata CBS 506.65]OJJ51080.1 hypothetical protein ASPZODRAFT_148441 [Penicilliopsis zonata CBS 506.65]
MSRNPRSQTPYRPYEESSSSFATRPLALPTYPPLRAHGHEGYDFRRPVMATSVTPHAEEVIDLTNEPDTPPQHARPERRASRPSRPPRFGRNIITDLVDLEEDEHEAEGRQDTPINLDPPSPEDVQFVRANVRPPPPPPTRNRPFSARSSLRDFLRMRAPDFRGLAHLHPPPPLDMIWLGEEPRDGLDSAINLDLDVPFGLSFPPLVNNPPPRSTYKPPSPPPPGFTRNVKEEDVVVCPNCDAELGVGDEIKAQIWVAKPCGHVYCGECARNRSLSKAKKAVTKVKPFAKCQVEDCGKPVSAPKAMFQVYL